MPSWEDFVQWAIQHSSTEGGRSSLRRRWEGLRKLAQNVADQVGEQEVHELLGKPIAQLDPEHNDLKALVAYGVGRGLIQQPGELSRVLEEDVRADPLHFLSQHSGKTFGEKFAPLITEFWLAEEGDGWEKQPSSGYYDVGWFPRERDGREIRIELKASSESPAFRFQQVRHPNLGGNSDRDYDLLLCLGVSAGSLEWWAIPARDLDQFADNGQNPSERTVITRHHGKTRPIWNDEFGYVDEGWFLMNKRTREVLNEYACEQSENLRAKILSLV